MGRWRRGLGDCLEGMSQCYQSGDVLFAKQVFPRFTRPGEMTLTGARLPFLSAVFCSSFVIPSIDIVFSCYSGIKWSLYGRWGLSLDTKTLGTADRSNRTALRSRPVSAAHTWRSDMRISQFPDFPDEPEKSQIIQSLK